MADPRLPLAGMRLVATLPVHSDHGYARFAHRVAANMIATLTRLGADVLPFILNVQSWADLRPQVAAIKTFDPDFVISTPGAASVFLCQIDGRNLFFDELGLPTVLFWDTFDIIFNLILAPHRDQLAGSARSFLRKLLEHPLAFHCVYDSGHADLMRALGVMTTPNVRVVLAPARDHAVEYAGSHPTTDTYDEDVAFIGTVQAPEFVHDNVAAAFVQAFRERVLAAATEPTAAMWRPILQQMERTPAHELLAAQLTFDHPFFWLFVSFGILAEATMIGRQHLLRELGRPVSCYLLFDEPPESPLRKLDRIALKPAVDAITELPRLNAVTRVTVDLVSRNYIHAVTTKIIDCYAAGGFCLFNAQEDFRRAFGGDAEKVTYTDMADLNAKLEYFLSHERERRETAAHFQKLILERHQFATDIVATLEWAKALRR